VVDDLMIGKRRNTMSPEAMNPARRLLLKRSADLAALVALAVVVGNSPQAAAKAAKSEFMYQDHGHDGKTCGQCKFYSSGDPKQPLGTCSIVDGVISRDGWCAAFAPKILA
jgi:hypothetical protein